MAGLTSRNIAAGMPMWIVAGAGDGSRAKSEWGARAAPRAITDREMSPDRRRMSPFLQGPLWMSGHNHLGDESGIEPAGRDAFEIRQRENLMEKSFVVRGLGLAREHVVLK